MDIDTIRLKFRRSKPNNPFFTERKYTNGRDSEYRITWTNNAWRKEQQGAGIYIPKYSIEQDYNDSSVTYFYFEASIPKLLKEKSITPFENYQFDEVIKAIINFCQRIGIIIFSEEIRNAYPTLLAIGENLNLTDLCSVNNALRILKPFDYKPHSKQRVVDFSDCKHGGKEIIFSTSKTETFKAYDKGKEIRNIKTKTNKEAEIANLLKDGQFEIDSQPASEILRIELTLKDGRKIREKLKPYLGNLPATFENIFNRVLWKNALKDEVDRTFNHPLQKMIFLSQESQPFIDSFLDKNYRHIQTKDTIRGLLASLQDFGLAETRKNYLERYRSRQTWYNYLRRLKELEKHFDWTELSKLDNVKIHFHILKHFGISNSIQQEFGLFFDTKLSKNIDIKQRNALK